MGYIIKKTEPLVNVKLTDKGREKLSIGQLHFVNCSLSDGEMVYTNDNTELLNILRPADNQPAATYMVPSEGTNYIVPITSIVSFPQISHNAAKERGFFTGTTQNEYIFDYMLCGAYRVPKENFQGETTLEVEYYAGETVTGTTINPSGATPTIGDLMLIKVPKTGYTGTVAPDTVDVLPLAYMWYEIQGISGSTVSGFTVEVDRLLPNLHLTGTTTGCTGYAYFYKGGDMIHDVFDEEYPYAYWSQGLLDFTDTCSNGAHDVPVWNMNVVYVMDAIGLDGVAYKSHDDVISNNYRGLHPYLKYAANVPHQNKFGIIHYTNNTVNNYYGEGFYINDPYTVQLHLPTLMWHKKQFGGAGYANTIGYTFSADLETGIQYIDNLRYFDLIDAEIDPSAVGKVFPDLQLIVIEDEELITAMSLKSNRNWSLPKPVLTDIEPGNCAGSTSEGIITSEEELHVTYALIDRTNEMTGVHCENFTTIGTTKEFADVLFRFPYDPEDPTYSEFGYFKKRSDGVGFSADDIWIILQKTPKGSMPEPNGWQYFLADGYLDSNGCTPIVISTVNNYELYSQSTIVSNVTTTNYLLDKAPIGDVIVSRNGHILKEALDLDHLYPDPTCDICGDYKQLSQEIYFGITSGHTTGGTPTNLQVGDLLQFHYLIGTVIAATTVKLDVFVPTTIPAAPADIYREGAEIYIDLPTTPAGQVYMFYNAHVLSYTPSNYSVVPGTTTDWRILFGFVPEAGARITVLYLDETGGGGGVSLTDITPTQINDFKVILNNQTFPMLATETYDINHIISVPVKGSTGMTFGDETFFFGNVETEIKATTYKSIINVTVLPNRFVTSNNPTFNANIHKVAFTEIDIYDDDGDVVAVGKFSQPLQRKLNSDVQIINAVIDF